MKTRKIIRTFKPYEWEPTNEDIALKVGLKPEQIVRFDTNTNPFTPTSLLKKLEAKLESLKVNEYPDTSYIEFRSALARYLKRDIEEITVTTGADEALDIISKVFIDPETKVIVSAPTYSMYRIVIETLGGRLINIQRRSDFSDDVDAILKSVDGKTRLICLCSPNNPTGNVSLREDILRLLEKVECPILVDEAYAEFCGQSSIDLVSKYENLLVVKTFSKAFAMAGARVGYVVANRKTIRLINIMRPPNSLSIISLALAKIALDNLDYIQKTVETIVKERDRFSQMLRKIGKLKVFPSQANFIMVKIKEKDASYVSRKLLESGFMVRSLDGHTALKNCLRFTVRKPEENNALLKVLEKTLGS